MKTIIKNGTIVTSSDIFKGDIQIENGIINELANNIKTNKEDHIIDATNQYVLPGGIDPHVHLANPGTVDDFHSGTRAAAMGGITSFINYVNPEKGKSALESLSEWKNKAKASFIDYGFHSIINSSDERILDELPILAEDEGVTSIKLFMANQDKSMEVNDDSMYKLMKKAGESGIITNVHAENGNVIDNLILQEVSKGNTDPIYHALSRPSILESEATNRALRIAESADAPIYIVHVTNFDALNQVEQAKIRGAQAYAETCPHYLVFDQSYLELPNFESGKYVCSPPLREKDQQRKLWGGIALGTISSIGSDHSSIPFENGKSLGMDDFTKIPNGCPGIEDIFSVFYHFGVNKEQIPLQKFVEITSAGPAKIFGLYPKKGTIMVGGDADIVILDPNQSRTISKDTQYQSTDYNLYEGIEIQGAISHVLSRGEEIVCKGSFYGESGRGEYLYRNKFMK